MTAYLIITALLFSSFTNPNRDNLTGTKSPGQPADAIIDPGLDKEYWYTGKAELTRYDLDQIRYGSPRKGEVIRIFVTEDFLTDKQVKNESNSGSNSVSVLKMNDIRRFTTGIYDYSIMTTVFTRADGSGTEKITLSSQDWCGQSFVQLNRERNKYRIQVRSYFESEGDQDVHVSADLLEDEIPNLIRIDDMAIPEGEVMVLPSLTYLRLSHEQHKAFPAIITKSDKGNANTPGSKLRTIKLTYPGLGRDIEIVFDQANHNSIVSWTETSRARRSDVLNTTTARQTHQVHEAYWSLNSPADSIWRERLGLRQ